MKEIWTQVNSYSRWLIPVAIDILSSLTYNGGTHKFISMMLSQSLIHTSCRKLQNRALVTIFSDQKMISIIQTNTVNYRVKMSLIRKNLEIILIFGSINLVQTHQQILEVMKKKYSSKSDMTMIWDAWDLMLIWTPFQILTTMVKKSLWNSQPSMRTISQLITTLHSTLILMA